MVDENFNKAFEELIGLEGGYVNDPSDSGGETNWGVTKNTARRAGYKGDMRDMTLIDAKNIYLKLFWHKIKLEKVKDYDIAFELFEQAVNMGLRKPQRWLQENLNVLNRNNPEQYWEELKVDGKVGDKTISVLNQALKKKYTKENLLKLMNIDQGSFYKKLAIKRPKDERFINGWLKHRVILPEQK